MLRSSREWQPPAEADFQAFYINVDYSGGMAILNIDSASTLAETMAPWLPVVALHRDAGRAGRAEHRARRHEAIAFRDSVGYAVS